MIELDELLPFAERTRVEVTVAPENKPHGFKHCRVAPKLSPRWSRKQSFWQVSIRLPVNSASKNFAAYTNTFCSTFCTNGRTHSL